MRKKFQAITTVYSYYLPEVRKIIDELVREYPHDVFLQSVNPGLDDFHKPIIEKLIEFYKSDVPQLVRFSHRYPTSGSEEGIREFMSFLQVHNADRVYMFQGDYEGYREVAKTRNLFVQEVDWGTDPKMLRTGYWFLSNPSARNGMIIPNDVVYAICEAGHKVFYDLSYLGTTHPNVLDVSHPNVTAVAISFSKPYGLFYYRVGFMFCRHEIPALYANKWFKNILSLLIAKRIMEKLERRSFVEKYRSLQSEIVSGINSEHGLGVTASDAFLLARLDGAKDDMLTEEQKEMVKKFKRADEYRFCLTPYFLERENSINT